MTSETTRLMGEVYTLARLMKDDPAFEEGQRAVAASIVARFEEVVGRLTALESAEDAE